MAKRKIAEFVEQDEAQVEQEPVVVMPDEVQARIKGTWTMYWGHRVFNFVDGTRYSVPRDLYAYLRKNGNIYDTL
jgi:hypothetical protein